MERENHELDLVDDVVNIVDDVIDVMNDAVDTYDVVVNLQKILEDVVVIEILSLRITLNVDLLAISHLPPWSS